MKINSTSNNEVSYNANGEKIVRERNSSNSSFSNDLENLQGKSYSTTARLVEDINSLFKTGLTIDEFQKMQELLEAIKKKVDELEAPLSTEKIEEIDEMFRELERMILEFQLKIKGEAITEFKSSASNIQGGSELNLEQLKDDEKNSYDIAGYLKRIEKTQETINDLKNNQVDKSNKTAEELELLLKLKQAI